MSLPVENITEPIAIKLPAKGFAAMAVSENLVPFSLKEETRDA